MTQSLPAAEIKTTGSGNRGLSAAHGELVWLGSGLQLTGDSYQTTGDGNNHSTDSDTAVVEGDTTTSTQTITVESETADEGRLLFVFDGGGNATSNTITISGGTGVTINGTSNITSDNGTTMMLSDGTDYWVIT